MFFVDLLTDLYQKIDEMKDLEQITCQLQNFFSKLPIAVKHSLRSKGIELNDVILLIDQKLYFHSRTKWNSKMKEVERYQQELCKISNMDDLFLFLHRHDFYGYLNYVLLKEISELAEDQNIASKFNQYEDLYVKLISNTTFKDIIPIFHQNSKQKPAVPIGLPRVIFKLEEHWKKKTLSNFIDESDLPHFESFLLSELRDNCIIMTYAVFPSVLSDVIEYLKSSTVQQKFQELGVSVELPVDLGKNKC